MQIVVSTQSKCIMKYLSVCVCGSVSLCLWFINRSRDKQKSTLIFGKTWQALEDFDTRTV